MYILIFSSLMPVLWLLGYLDLGYALIMSLFDQLGSSNTSDAVAILEETMQESEVGSIMSKWKIIATFCQIVGEVPNVYLLTEKVAPGVYLRMMQIYKLFSLDILPLLPTACMTERRYYVHRLLLITLFPILFISVLFVLYYANISWFGRPRRKVRDVYLFLACVLLHLLLPLIATTCFQALVCDKFIYAPHDHRFFLHASPNINCSGGVYRSFILPYALLMIAIYPIGVPLLYFCVLYNSRDLLYPVTHIIEYNKTSRNSSQDDGLELIEHNKTSRSSSLDNGLEEDGDRVVEDVPPSPSRAPEQARTRAMMRMRMECSRGPNTRVEFSTRSLLEHKRSSEPSYPSQGSGH